MRDFDEFVEQCQRFLNENGHLYVPVKYQNEGYKLGEKVHNVRRGLIKTNVDEKKILNQMGFIWKVRNDYDFMLVYRLLLIYKAVKGNLHVPLDYATQSGIPLGRIVHHIRKGWKKVSPVQEEQLRAIGFEFKKRECETKNRQHTTSSKSVRGPDIKDSYKIIRYMSCQKEEAVQGIQALVNSYMEKGYLPTGNFYMEKEGLNYIAYQPMILLD